MSDENHYKKEVIEIPLHSLSMKQLIELDACTRCGECLTWCPVYDQDAKEEIIPRRKVIDFLKIAKAQEGVFAKIMKNEKLSSPLRSMLGRVFGYKKIEKAEIDNFVKNLYECSTCGQCEVVCPAHIETVTLWEELRRIIVQAGYGPLEAQKALVKSVKAFDNPWQQPRAARTKWARRAKKDGLIQALPREIKKTGGKVLLFFGCTAAYDVNVKQVAINTINILEALGVDYGVLGSEEKCCASVLLRMGDPEHERVFKENIDLFNSLGIETLISSCSGCFKTIMQDYPKVAPINFEVLHTVEYLVRFLKQGKLKFSHPVHRTVTYHDPCHLGRATGGFEAPRTIMNAIPGLKLVEMPRNREYSRCCGAGGGLKAGYPEIQNKMAQRRVKEAEESGAEQLVSCCPFCFQGLNIGITGLESQVVMRDLSSLVAESILGYDVFEKAAEKAAEKAKGKEAKKAAREKTRADKKTSAVKKKAEPEQKMSAAESSPSDKKTVKNAEKERKRAARRAARTKEKITKSETRAAETSESVPSGFPAGDPKDDHSAKAAMKAEKERKRAEKRAARRQKKVEELKIKEEDSDAVSVESDAQTDVVLEVVEKQKNKGTEADRKAEKERKRAEKRAAREKEKAERRAARK